MVHYSLHGPKIAFNPQVDKETHKLRVTRVQSELLYECNNNYSKGQTPFNPTVSVSKHFTIKTQSDC